MRQTGPVPARHPRKRYPTIAACGLDCGLCPRYYTRGTSRCPGCAGPGFHEKHPSCAFITCCVRKKGLEVCGECPEFPCARFKSDEEYGQLIGSSSYPPPRNMLPNLRFIKEHGIGRFVAQHRLRMRLLATMIRSYDDGRSRSFYCRATACLSPISLRTSLETARRKGRADGLARGDIKGKAQALREILTQAARREGVVLV